MRSMIPGYRTFRAIRFLITGPMILAMLFVIQLMTPGGHLWFRWAASASPGCSACSGSSGR